MSGSFAAIVTGSDGPIDLARAALEIARDAYPDLDATEYIVRLDGFARSIRRAGFPSHELLSRSERMVALDRLNDFLFDKLGFTGARGDYYDPINSYLNVVLDRRHGLPITLSVIYLEVARRLGVPLSGVGLPGHFVVGWFTPGEPLFIDAFNEGELLGVRDLQDRVNGVYGQQIPLQSAWLQPVSNRYILHRILSNLKAACSERGLYEEAARASEKILALDPNNAAEHRDLGAFLAQTGQRWAALQRLERYIELAPEAPDTPAVKRLANAIFEGLGGET